jgi:hypothetical protein
MAMQVDTQILLGIVIFVSVLTYFLSQYGLNTYSTVAGISKPLCSISKYNTFSQILDTAGCGFTTLMFMVGLSNISTGISFLNYAIFLPLGIIIIYLIIRIGRGV